MMKFNMNPIVVKDGGRPFKIIELDYDIKDNVKVVEFRKKDNSLISSHSMSIATLLSLDKNEGNIRVLFKDEKDNVIGEQIVDTLSIDETPLDENVIDDVYSKIKSKVSMEMDNPRGTDIEVSRHTQLLKQVTYNKNARIYIMSKIRNIITSMALVDGNEIEDITYRVYSDLYGMGVLQELDDDPTVGEILVNAVTYPAFKSTIYYYKDNIKYKYNKEFTNLSELKMIFNRTIEFDNKQINAVEYAEIDAIRPNRDRVHIIVPGASENWLLNIRKFTNFVPNVTSMKNKGTIDNYLEELVELAVKAKANIGIGGPMNSGKTTFINYLLTYTQPIERKVVIASVAETDIERVLKGHDVCILNVNDDKNFTFEKHLKSALRTTASRIVIPEARGEEFRQVYEANIKTKGNMFTVHVLDEEDFMDMCVDMYNSSGQSSDTGTYITNKLAKSIDLVFIMRTVGDQIRIKSVSEVLVDEKGEFAGMNVLYRWWFDPEDPMVGHYERTNNRLSERTKKRWNEAGIKKSVLDKF